MDPTAPPISIVASTIFNIGPLGITSSVLAFLLVTGIILIMLFFTRRRLAIVPGRLQTAVEAIVVYLDDTLYQQFGSRKLSRFFLPIMVTIFLYILISNQFSLIPLLQSVVVSGEEPAWLFTTPTADLGFTVMMAFILIVMSQVIAFFISPLRHIGNYFKIVPVLKAIKNLNGGDFFMAGIEFMLGLLDIIGEIAKVISLSARLFGNVLAGGLIIMIVSDLAVFTAYFVPIPFFVLSIFSGVVQAFVFVLLAMGFMSTTINAARPEPAA